MKNEGANKTLNDIATARAKEAFHDDYSPEHYEALGLVISSHFEWDGLRILETFGAALEDANFHQEAGLVSHMIDKIQFKED